MTALLKVHASPILSVTMLQKSPFNFLKIFCFAFVNTGSVLPHCSFPAYLPCLVPVMWGAESPMSSGYLRTIASSITHYKGQQEHKNTHKHVQHWSLGLQECFHWSQVKTANHNSTLTSQHLWRPGYKLFSRKTIKRTSKLLSSNIFLSSMRNHWTYWKTNCNNMLNSNLYIVYLRFHHKDIKHAIQPHPRLHCCCL